MSWGSSQHTQSQQQQQQQGGYSNTTTPNLPPWLQSAFQGFVNQGQNLSATAAQPVFGQAQQASYLQNLNDLANQSTAKLSSTLASKGISNSGAMAQGATDIQTQRLASESGFLSQLPFQETQAHLANEEGALGAGLAAAKSVPYGQTATGTSSGLSNSNSNSTTTTDPGIAGLVSSLGGMAIGGLTGGLGGSTGGSKAGGMPVPSGASPYPESGTIPGSGFAYTPQPAPYVSSPSGGWPAAQPSSTWGQNVFNTYNPFGAVGQQ